MASQTTPKGRVHHEGVTPHGEADDSQGLCTPPKWLRVGNPAHGECDDSQGSGCTFSGCHQLGSIHRSLNCTSGAS